MNTVNYKGNLTVNTFRGPSDSLWSDAPVLDIIENPSWGMHFYDDFLMVGSPPASTGQGNMGQWASYIVTDGVLGADPGQEGGVILLSDAGNTGINLALGSNATSYRLVSPATNYPLQPGGLWFETRVAVGSITTAKRDAFVGLVDNTAFTTSGAATVINGTTNTLTTTNGLIGFHFRSTTNPTDVGFCFNVAGGTVQYPTNLQTLSNTVLGAALTAYTAGGTGLPATGFIKLGFKYTPYAQPNLISSASSGQTAGTVYKSLIQIFVNGLVASAFLDSTNLQAATFPTTYMAPYIGYTSRSGTAAGGLYVDFLRVCQQAQY